MTIDPLSLSRGHTAPAILERAAETLLEHLAQTRELAQRVMPEVDGENTPDSGRRDWLAQLIQLFRASASIAGTLARLSGETRHHVTVARLDGDAPAAARTGEATPTPYRFRKTTPQAEAGFPPAGPRIRTP